MLATQDGLGIDYIYPYLYGLGLTFLAGTLYEFERLHKRILRYPVLDT